MKNSEKHEKEQAYMPEVRKVGAFPLVAALAVSHTMTIPPPHRLGKSVHARQECLTSLARMPPYRQCRSQSSLHHSPS